MNNSNSIWMALLAVAIIAFVGWNLPKEGGVTALLGGVTNFDSVDVTDGYLVDATTVINGSGQVVAPLSSSGTSTVTKLIVEATASTTVQIGNIGAGVGPGCIILGDSGGATSSPVYITASGTTITAATTTRPAICAIPG